MVKGDSVLLVFVQVILLTSEAVVNSREEQNSGEVVLKGINHKPVCSVGRVVISDRCRV